MFSVVPLNSSPTPPISDGDYSGEWKDGSWEGVGTMRWSDGTKYSGGWMRGRMEGEGTLTYSSGDVYVGGFSDGRKHGAGSYRHARGDKYVGEWRFDQECGYGTYTWTWGDFYAGYWREGKMHDYGVLSTGGELYEGWHDSGFRNGRGRAERADGVFYIGEWAQGRREGVGTLVAPDGSGFNGCWLKDAMHGQGTWFTPAGEHFSGEWSCGTMHGVAYPTYPMLQQRTDPVPPSDLATKLRDEPPRAPLQVEVVRSKLWWRDMIQGEAHMRVGWADEGLGKLRQECLTEQAPDPLSERAELYARENPGTGTVMTGRLPVRPLAREAYMLLCAERGVRSNGNFLETLPEDMTTHQLTHIDVSRTYLGDQGACVVVHFLSSCPNVATLAMRDLHLGQEVVMALGMLGEKHPKLKSVDLSGNFIEQPAAKQLHRMVCRNTNIEHLHLQGCQVNTGLVKQISQRLRYNTAVNQNRVLTAPIP
eukprot:Hpha_TRINITY_DN15829_c1_g12::TRINITY_DN15829_c1_g12_i1::g.191219::m.191219